MLRGSLFVLVAVFLVGCGESDKLSLGSAAGTFIVQPEHPLRYHTAWIIDSDQGVPDDIYVEPGSIVRIFREDCTLLTQLTFDNSAGVGDKTYSVDSSGKISINYGYDVMGDPGPGAVDHEPCPIP